MLDTAPGIYIQLKINNDIIFPKHAFSNSRTHTVILIDGNNKVDFYEKTMATTDPDGEWITTHLQTEF